MQAILLISKSISFLHPDLFYSYYCLLLSRFFLIHFHTAVYKKCILKNGSNNIFVRITWCAILKTSAIFSSLNRQVILLSRKYIFISQKYFTVDFSDMVLTDIFNWILKSLTKIYACFFILFVLFSTFIVIRIFWHFPTFLIKILFKSRRDHWLKFCTLTRLLL